MTPPTMGPIGVLEDLGSSSDEESFEVEVCLPVVDAMVESASMIWRLMLVSGVPLDSVPVLDVSSSDVDVGKYVDSYIETSIGLFAQTYAVSF